MNTGRKIETLGLCIMAAVLFCAYARADEQTERLSRLGSVEQGQKAPWLAGFDVFEPTRAMNLTKLLKSPGGKRLAVVFFATWCEPCKKGLAMLSENKKKLSAAGVRVVLVDVREEAGVVSAFLEKKNLHGFDALLDKFGTCAKSYGLAVVKKGEETLAIPKTFIIDKQGRLAAILGREGTDYVDRIIEAR